MRISDWSSDVCSSDLRGWMPQTATLIIVGALSPDEGFALAKRLFANWTGQASAAETPRTSAPSGPRLIAVAIPAAGQTAVIAAMPTVGLDDADGATLRMSSEGLGGGFPGCARKIVLGGRGVVVRV